MRTAHDLAQRMRDRSYKLTSQRLLIYQYLAGNPEHPTAEQVYEEVRRTLPTISLTTVYKILNELVELGEVLRLDFGDGAARFDPNTEHHIHARCRRCGAVLDLASAVAPVRLPEHANGFHVDGYQLLLEGTCLTCRSTASTTAIPTAD